MATSWRAWGIAAIFTTLGMCQTAPLAGQSDNPLRTSASEVRQDRDTSREEGDIETAASPTRKRHVDPAVRHATYTTSASRRPTPVRESVLTLPGDELLVDHAIIGGGVEEIEIIHEPAHVHMQKSVPQKSASQKGCCDGGGCWQCCIPCLPWDQVEVFGGVNGFTGPFNRGGSGSFGFYEGVNWGFPAPCFGGWLGAQVGLRATQSNLSGGGFPGDPAAPQTQIRTEDIRNQIFLTGGLFRRVDWGLQGGVVVDYLSQDWYGSVDLVQMRTELSWVFPCSHEIGFWFNVATEEDTLQTNLIGAATAAERYESTDLYAIFYRHRSDALAGAEARCYVGFSGTSDGVLGGDLRLPLNDDLTLEAGFAYLVPEQGDLVAPFGGFAQESWNLSVGFVWYPGARSATESDYFRPLFNVADNGSFMADRLLP